MGVIRARISDELEQKIQERIEMVKDSFRGGEINTSTVIRYSLEKYLDDERDIENGIKTVKFDLKKFSDEELELIRDFTKKLIDLRENKEDDFSKQLLSVNHKTYEIEIEKIKSNQ